MFMMKMPSSANPRITSRVKMRSFAGIGVAGDSIGAHATSSCTAAMYARGCASMKSVWMIFLWIGLAWPLAGLAADAAPGGAGGTDSRVRSMGRAWLESNDGIGLSIGIYDGTER